MLIVERVLANDVADYIRFRAVCRTWRRCSTDPRRHSALDSRFHPRQWLIILQENEDEEEAPHRQRFMNIATGQCIEMDLPELDHPQRQAFGPTEEGLLVLVDERSLVVRVLNPFTRRLTQLPSAATLLCGSNMSFRHSYARDLTDGDISVIGDGLAGYRTFALAFNGGTLAVAGPGSASWTPVVRRCSWPWAVSFLSFAGRFYCVADGAVMVVKNAARKQLAPPQLEVVAQLLPGRAARYRWTRCTSRRTPGS